MMALLNRPLTEDEARKMLADWRVGYPKLVSMWQMAEEARENPTPHTVRYAAVHNSFTYVAPTSLYWGKSTSPSDCEWIIPGTM